MKQHLVKAIRILCVIPIVVGILNCVEGLFPYQKVNTIVVSKDSQYSLKLDKTSFHIDFKEIRANVTEEIYRSLDESDSVLISVTYFNHEIDKIQKISSAKIFNNDTGDKLALILFSILYLIISISSLLLIRVENGKKISSERKAVNNIIIVFFFLFLIFSSINLLNMINPSYSSL